MPKIAIMKDNEVLSELPLDNSEVVIGRGDDCHIILQDSLASWKHAKIVKAYGGYMVEDLNSTNGVTINSRRVTKQMLKIGDKIRIGSHDLCFNKGPGDKSAQPEKTMLADAAGASVATSQKPIRTKLRFLTGPDSGLSQAITIPYSIDKADGNSAIIIRKGDDYFLQRVSGKNINLNEQLVSSIGSQLKSGDKIQVGTDEMRFFIE